MAACGHVSTSSHSLRFNLSLRLYSSFITSRSGSLTLCILVEFPILIKAIRTWVKVFRIIPQFRILRLTFFGLNNIYSGKVHDRHKNNVKIIGYDILYDGFGQV